MPYILHVLHTLLCAFVRVTIPHTNTCKNDLYARMLCMINDK